MGMGRSTLEVYEAVCDGPLKKGSLSYVAPTLLVATTTDWPSGTGFPN